MKRSEATYPLTLEPDGGLLLCRVTGRAIDFGVHSLVGVR